MAAKTYSTRLLKYGLQADYDAIASKDSDVLYFTTDTKKIYKGTIDFTDHCEVVASKPASPAVGRLYVITGTGTAEVWNGSAWTVVSYALEKSTTGGGTGITASSTDDKVATAKAVYDFVEAEIEELADSSDVIKSIVAKTDATTPANAYGKITYTTGDDVTHDVTIPHVVTNVTYDSTTREFVFTGTDGISVTATLGKDIFLEPGASYYDSSTHKIILVLNDADPSAQPPVEATTIEIDVADLIDEYTAGTTDSITGSTSNNVHSYTVNIRPSWTVGSETVTNRLRLSTTAGDKGLYVDTSDIEADIDGLDSRLQTAEGAITTLNADSTTAGSVDYKIAQAQSSLQSQITDNADSIDNLATAALSWGTF